MSLSRQILAYFGSLAVVGILGFLGIWWKGLPFLGMEGIQSNEIRRVAQSTEILADNERDHFEWWIAERRRELGLLARSLELQISRNNRLSTTTVLTLDAVATANAEAYRRIYVVNPGNDRVLIQRIDTESFKTPPPEHMAVLSDAENSGISEAIGIVEQQGRPALLILNQLQGRDAQGSFDGRTLGTLVVEIDLEAPLQHGAALRRSLGGIVGALLVDWNHRILAQAILQDGGDLTYVSQAAQNGSEGTKLLNDARGRDMVVTYRHLHLGAADGLTLAIVRDTAESLALLGVPRTFAKLGALGLGLLTLSIALVLFAVRHISANEKRLRRGEERLRATVESSPNLAIQWYDATGRVLYWNKGSEQLFGISVAEAVGHRIGEAPLKFDDAMQSEAFVAKLGEVAACGQPYGPFEYRLRHKNGDRIAVLATIFAIPNDEEGFIFVCMGVDITQKQQAEAALRLREHELRQLNEELESRVELRTRDLATSNSELNAALEQIQQTQKELARSERLASLGSLVAGVAHELNTPIGNCLVTVTTLCDETRSFRKQMTEGIRRSDLENFMASMERAGDITARNLSRAADLISSFKQVAVDQTSAQRRRFTLAEVVNEILLTLHPVLKRTPFEVKTNIAADAELDSYPGALGQVLTNLINNAVIHGFAGRSEGSIQIDGRTSDDKSMVTVVVSDNGNGIAPELLPRIFDPFVTTRLGKGGSGLGLNILHNLVTDILGGSVLVRSTPGIGTSFEIRLPTTVGVGAPQKNAALPVEEGSGR